MDRADRKWDNGKIKYRLVLPEFLELMAKILTEGEKNHPCEPNGQPSWQLVEPEAYEDALFRHFQAYRKGEMHDKDMKFDNEPCDHMGNIAVNAMFLWWFNRKKEYDERLTLSYILSNVSDYLPLNTIIFDEEEGHE